MMYIDYDPHEETLVYLYYACMMVVSLRYLVGIYCPFWFLVLLLCIYVLSASCSVRGNYRSFGTSNSPKAGFCPYQLKRLKRAQMQPFRDCPHWIDKEQRRFNLRSHNNNMLNPLFTLDSIFSWIACLCFEVIKWKI